MGVARRLAGSPGFTATAVLTLALGIGAGTSIFTVVNALLLRGLPYRDADRLAEIAAPPSDQRDAPGWLSFPHFTALGERNRSFSSVAACTFEIFNLTGHGEPEQVPSARVSWNFFQVLGVEPLAGRMFLPMEKCLIAFGERVFPLALQTDRTRQHGD